MKKEIEKYNVNIGADGRKRIYFVPCCGNAHKIVTEECASWNLCGIHNIKQNRLFPNRIDIEPVSMYWYDDKKREIASWSFDMEILTIYELSPLGDPEKGVNPDFYNQLEIYEIKNA